MGIPFVLEVGGHTMTGAQLDADVTTSGDEPIVGAARVEEPLTPAERAALGHSARESAPHESHAAWAPAAEGRDPIALLEAQASTRVPELMPIR